MSRTARTAWAVVFVALAGGAVNAQTFGPAASGAETSEAAADLAYKSTFEGFKRFTDEKVISWKEANDNVGRIGGWREYAKEARQPESSAVHATVPVSSNSAEFPATREPHSGHGQR